MNSLKKLAALAITLIIVSGCFNSLYSQEEWKMEPVGTYDWFYEIKIGDGRNDGINRLYSATYDGHLLEWTFNKETFEWEMEVCGEVPGSAEPVYKRIISIWIGKGRNDNLNRIYGACVNGYNYEFFYDSSSDSWEMNPFGYGYFQTGIIVGDSRNDNVNRVISSGYQVKIMEHSWLNNSWSPTMVSAENIDVWPSYIGHGRNDNINRIYSPNWSKKYLHEFSWNGSSYDEVKIDMDHPLVKSITGDGHNDGVIRVYSSEWDGHVVESYWDGNDWISTDIMEGQADNHSRYGLCFGKTHDDDVNRLYSVAQFGALREHYYEDGEWNNTEIDAITGATADLTVGDARNDNINRVYVAGSNGNLYEYTHTDFTNLNIVGDLPDKLLISESYTYNLDDYFTHENGDDITYSIIENIDPEIVGTEIIDNQLIISRKAIGITTLKLLATSSHEGIVSEFSIKVVEPYLNAGFGSSYNLTGEEYISLGNHESFNLNDSITCQLWINIQSIGSEQEIIGKATWPMSGWKLSLTSQGKLEFFVRTVDNTFRTVLSDSVLVENEWYHVSMVYDGFNSSIYINGILDNVETFDEQSNIKASEDSDLRIGKIRNGPYAFSGRIDDVRIWNTCVSEEEISYCMGNNLSGSETDLICYINFDEAFGKSVIDLVSKTNHEIVNGNEQNWQFSDIPVTYNVGKYRNLIESILPNNNDDEVEYMIIENNCAHGTLTLINDQTGEFSYKLEDQVCGEDFFSYKVVNGDLESEIIEGKIQISEGYVNVNEINSANSIQIHNYPNPFKNQTTISFNLSKQADVKMEIFNVSGSVILCPINRKLKEGSHEVIINAANMTSGIYHCKLTINGEDINMKKMLLLK